MQRGDGGASLHPGLCLLKAGGPKTLGADELQGNQQKGMSVNRRRLTMTGDDWQ